MAGLVFIIAATLFLAFSNGANDNFKGVATLYGSRSLSYKKALIWATVTTLAGSLTAVLLAKQLITVFSGKGLVPDHFANSPDFLLAVIVGAGVTVFLASISGIPISTTHSLTGSLVGAGFMAAGNELALEALGRNFLYPLLASPIFAILLTILGYSALSWLKRIYPYLKGFATELINRPLLVNQATNPPSMALYNLVARRGIQFSKTDRDQRKTQNHPSTQNRQSTNRLNSFLDGLHFLSAGSVGFARGLNDTPKIVAIALAAGIMNLQWSIGLTAVVMAAGGVLYARKVAVVMSRKITTMDNEQGVVANLITSCLVIFSSKMGFPVSTTHVSCGALFGIGVVSGKVNWKVMGGIVSAWVLTLPVAALFAAITYFILNWF